MQATETGLLDEAFDHARTAFVLTDAEGGVLRANRMATKTFGLTAGASLAFADPAPFLATCRSASGTGGWHVARLVFEDKQAADAHIRRLRAVPGEKVFAVSLDRCGQARQNFREASDARRSRQDALARARSDALKDRFIATVSHELRTPMTSILGALDIVVSGMAGAVDQPALGLLSTASQNVRALLRLINDLLDSAQAEAGSLQVALGPVDIATVLKEAAGIGESYPAPSGVRIVVLDQDSLSVMADHDRLRQVVLNLLSNALKYSPENGAVSLAASQNGEHVRITVKDQGAGIPVAFQTRVFERFAQADPGSMKKGASTGLGLAIVKDLMASFGGRVSFDTGARQGTSFHLDLCRADSVADVTPGMPQALHA